MCTNEYKTARPQNYSAETKLHFNHARMCCVFWVIACVPFHTGKESTYTWCCNPPKFWASSWATLLFWQLQTKFSKFLENKKERKEKKSHRNSLGTWSLSLHAVVKISSSSCLRMEQEAAFAQPGSSQGLQTWTESRPCAECTKATVDLFPCCLQILGLMYSLGKPTIKATLSGSKAMKMGPTEFLTVFTRTLWTASWRQQALALPCGWGTGYWYEWEKGKIKRSC